MAEQVTNYQCPNCGGPLHFDSATQQLKCDYCDSLFTPQEVEDYYSEANQQALSVETNSSFFQKMRLSLLLMKLETSALASS